MSSEPIISVSGLRGILGESLSPDLAIRYVAAFCASLPDGSIVVTRDGRATGPMLANAVHAAVVASGRICLDAGVAATPTTGVLVCEHRAAGGIQISASHNPPEYNGIKLFSNEGRIIPAGAGERVLTAYRNGETSWATYDRLGTVEILRDTFGEHLRRVLATVDAKRIRGRRFHVVLDANHGAGSVLGGPLLDELGCRITLLGEEPHGHFAHPAEPLAENLADIAGKARDVGADVTFCQDPDADRLAIIDENGRYIGEECTLAICVEWIVGGGQEEVGRGQGTGNRRQEGIAAVSTTGGGGVTADSRAVVTNCSTSRMSQDIAEKHGAAFYHSAVGEANVVDAMRSHNAILGGEGNGGVIDPRVGWVRDSFSGMALILDAMAATGKPISELADSLPRYAIHKTKVAVDRDSVTAAFDSLEKHFSDATSNRLDGLRLDWPDRKWLLIRASNTEPIVRVIAEAATAEEAEQLCEDATRVIA